MIKYVTKPEKIALCRVCHGTGKVSKSGITQECPNCDGSGRVLVACEMNIHVRPYKENK